MTYCNLFEFINNFEDCSSKPKSLACFLITLFYKSGCKYSCSRTKICRLLTIYALCRIGENDQFIDNYFYATTDDVNLVHHHISSIVDRDVYMLLSYTADDCKPFLNEFQNTTSIPDFYKEYLSKFPITFEEESLLETIFRTFASFPIHKLSTSIRDITSKMPFETNGIYNPCKLKISVKDFIKFLNNNADVYQDNQIFTFIRALVWINYKDSDKTVYFN